MAPNPTPETMERKESRRILTIITSPLQFGERVCIVNPSGKIKAAVRAEATTELSAGDEAARLATSRV